MHPQLTHLEHVAEFERLLSESDTRPLLVFKHSFTCGISAEALDELVEHLNAELHETSDIEPHYAMVTVQTHRDVSNAITQMLGVRHETPQALLIRNGKVVWAASHFRVTADAVRKALSGAENPAQKAAPQ